MINKYYTPKMEEICVGLPCVYTTCENGFNWMRPEDHFEDDLMLSLDEEGLLLSEIQELT